MFRCRYSAITVLTVIGCLLTIVLAGCGSSGNGRGEKVMDAHSFGGLRLYNYAAASSDKGVVTLLWVRDVGSTPSVLACTHDCAKASANVLAVSDLEPNTWDWSKPEVIARLPGITDDVAAAYDRSGRLLVAWTTSLGQDNHGDWLGIGVKERMRDADGRWQSTRLIARFPRKAVQNISGGFLNLSSGKRSFALGWYANTANSKVPYPSVSGFRILQNNTWLPPVYVGAEGTPVRVQLLDSRTPTALWVLPLEKKLMYAALRPNGGLGKPRVLAKADSSLVVSYDSRQAVAGWDYDGGAWAAVLYGKHWSEPKRLADWSDDNAALDPIATAVARGRALVFLGEAWTYCLWQHNKWTKPFPFAQNDSGINVSAGALSSGEIALAALGSRLHTARLPLAGQETYFQYSAKPQGQVQSSASSAKAVALAWEEDINAWEPHTNQHLFVWVYRP